MTHTWREHTQQVRGSFCPVFPLSLSLSLSLPAASQLPRSLCERWQLPAAAPACPAVTITNKKKKEKCIMIFLIVAFFILKPPVEAQSSQSTCSVHADWGYLRLICTPTRLHQELYEYMSRSLVLPAHSWMWWLDTEKWLTSRWRCSHINLLWLFERPSQACGQISTWNAN